MAINILSYSWMTFLIISCSSLEKYEDNSIPYEKEGELIVSNKNSNENIDYHIESPEINGYKLIVINTFKNKDSLLKNPYFMNGTASILYQKIEFYANDTLIQTYTNDKKNSLGGLLIFYYQFQITQSDENFYYDFQGWQGSNGGLEDEITFNKMGELITSERNRLHIKVDTTFNLYPKIK